MNGEPKVGYIFIIVMNRTVLYRIASKYEMFPIQFSQASSLEIFSGSYELGAARHDGLKQ